MNLIPTCPTQGEGWHTPRCWLFSLGLLAALTMAMFAQVLVAPENIVLSEANSDLDSLFAHWRRFGFEQLRQGNLALWNPHVYSGAPYFGGFEAALLYPPNVIFLILPLGMAINWSIILHVFMAGAFTYAWLARRKFHPLACFLAAVMFMFGGTFFPHIHAGHLPHLCTMVWVPLVFLAIDGLLEKPSLAWALLGVLAVAMQILAGFPQYVFYTGMAAGVYSILGLFNAPRWRRSALGLAGMVLGGMALSAVQLFTTFGESRETVRSGGLSFQMAAMFSFPPENFLTLITPDFFGGFKTPTYWGRCYLWEMCLFMSITGLVLAVTGMVKGERAIRNRAVVLLLLLSVLALGNHTPLFRWLYEWMPGFNKFRGTSKFMLLASLFFVLLAGLGLDALLRSGQGKRRLAAMTGVANLLVLGTALWLWQSGHKGAAGSGWQKLMLTVWNTGESYLPKEFLDDSQFVVGAAWLAARSLVLAGTVLLLLGFLFWRSQFSSRLAGVFVALAVMELFVFSRSSLTTFDLRNKNVEEMRNILNKHPGDYRILILHRVYRNATMSLGALGIWGYEPNFPVRYAEFIAFTQGLKPDVVSEHIRFTSSHLCSMLRCRFIFFSESEMDDRMQMMEATNYLPHLVLVQQCRVLSSRDEILAVMDQPDFDLRREVILETAPHPAPLPVDDPGTVRLLNQSTDWLDIEADVKTPSILLITDSYMKGWRARALPGSAQSDYQLLPADWCLRAVPLAAGHHRLRVEYVPTGFVAGKWISLTSSFVFVVLTIWQWRRIWRNCKLQASQQSFPQ